MSVITELANCTATVSRLDPDTGTWATISGGANVAGILDTPVQRSQPPGDGANLLGQGYTAQATQTLSLDGLTPVIFEGDRIAVTPTGGSARTYRAQAPRIYGGTLAHQEIPLSDYVPGGSS